MGSKLCTSKCCNSKIEPSTRVLMLGLDGAGKTAILYRAFLNETICTVPTIGFNVETVKTRTGQTFNAWDVGGQDKIRTMWRHYYVGTDGLLFIVDSSDRARFTEAKEELFNIIKASEMKGVPLVLIANKQDLAQAASIAEITEVLELNNIEDRKWHVLGASATNGDGVSEAMHEMARLVKDSC